MRGNVSYRILLWATILIGSMSQARGQFYDNGQDPAFLKWYRIETPHFRLIFPESFRPEANRLAGILDYSTPYVNYSLNSHPKKIPVIIHNQNTISNGMVVWAPKRVEFYTVPDPNSYPQDELEQLALHELRHVAQLEKINRKFTGALGYVTGELAAGGLSAMIPLWFMEGDAVASETILSHSGRGRLPSFEMSLRAIALEQKKVYKYDKSLLGSYRDYVPDWYEFGYQVTAWSRGKYGNTLWNNALDQVARTPYLINPVNLSFWKQARTTKRRLYDSAFLDLQKIWFDDDLPNAQTPASKRRSPAHPKAYTSYRFPRFFNDSVILAERSGIDDIERFVLIYPNGSEQVIHTPGYYQPVRLSTGGGKIVWAETVYDERWENRNFSVIKIYNPKTQTEWALTRRSRYFAPDINSSGTRIVAVRNEPDNTSWLDILDAGNGKVLQKFTLEGNVSFFKPVWQDSTHILVITLTQEGKDIREVNVVNNSWRTLYKSGFDDIQAIWPAGRYILFHSTQSGRDNIYALDTTSHHVLRLVSTRFGAFDPCLSPDGKTLVYADYHSGGFRLVSLPFNPLSDVTVNRNSESSYNSWEPLVKQEMGVPDFSQTPDSTYTVKRYRKYAHLLRIHSWLPFYFDYENLGFENFPVSPGLMLFTQNMLSTATGSLGYTFRDDHHELITRFTYKGWYPVFDLTHRYGGTPVVTRDSSGIPLPASLPARNEFTLRSYIPVNLTHNRFSQGVLPSVELRYSNNRIWDGETSNYDPGQTLVSYRLYYYSLLKRGDRDILPRLGISLDLRVVHAPWDKQFYGTRALAAGNLYLPGAMKHHTLRISAGHEQQNPSKFYYLNQLSFPRGYSGWLSEKLTTLNGEYVFPLLYPDLAISSLAYITRLRGGLFAEMATGKRNYDYHNRNFIQGPKSFTSFGGELTLDFYALRIGFPLSLGFWGAYMPSEETYGTGVTFNIDVYGLTINRKKKKPLGPFQAMQLSNLH